MARKQTAWNETSAYRRMLAAKLPQGERNKLTREYKKRYAEKGGRSASSFLSYKLNEREGKSFRGPAKKAAAPVVVEGGPGPDTQVVVVTTDTAPATPAKTPRKRSRKVATKKRTTKSAPRRRGPSRKEKELEAQVQKLNTRLKNRRGGTRTRKPKGFVEGVKADSGNLVQAALAGALAPNLVDGREVMGIPLELVAGLGIEGLKPGEYQGLSHGLVAIGAHNFQVRKALTEGGEKAQKVLAGHAKALSKRKSPEAQAAAARLGVSTVAGVGSTTEKAGLMDAVGTHAALGT